MNFTLCGYEFEGYYSDPNRFRDGPGVYIIWCKTDDRWVILEAGDSNNIREQILNHPRADHWRKKCNGKIHYSATYIDDPKDKANLVWRLLTE